MTIKIDDEFKALIPPLSVDEYQGLEESIIAEGCRDALIVWGDTLVDGHNRYKICTKHNIPYKTKEIIFESKAHARIWIRNNQISRRNLTDGWKIELALGNKADFAEIGEKVAKEKAVFHGNQYSGALSNIDNTPKHNTQKILAEGAGVSTGKLAQAEIIKAKAPDVWEEVKAGEKTVGGAYKKIKIKEKKADRKNTIAEASKSPLPSSITLLEGDIFSKLKEIPDKSIDLLVTDPPYWMDKGDWDKFKDLSDFRGFTKKWIDGVTKKLKPSYNAFISFNSEYFYMLETILIELGLPIKSRIIWHYRNAGGKSSGKYCFSKTYEPIVHFGTKKLNFPDVWDDTRFDVWTMATTQSNFEEGKYHPTQKPIELYERLIKYGSNAGDTILDCFAGSGTSGVVCKKNNRNCVLIEKDKEYCVTIKGRVNNE